MKSRVRQPMSGPQDRVGLGMMTEITDSATMGIARAGTVTPGMRMSIE